jgi:putative ABC transport system ATP-binding protein
LLLGRETSQLNKYALARVRNATFGFVFQNFNLLPRASALQNVTLPLIYAGVKRRERLSRGREVLRRVGLSDRISHRPSELSGGEQQRVAIARALVNRPNILLADEPTGNLDSNTSKHIVRIFEDLVNEGLTVVLVSHDTSIVDRATRKVRLADSLLLEEKLIIA